MRTKWFGLFVCLLIVGCGSSGGPGTAAWARAGLEKKGETKTEANCVTSEIQKNMPKNVIHWAFEVVVLGGKARLPESFEGKKIQIEELHEIANHCVQ